MLCKISVWGFVDSESGERTSIFVSTIPNMEMFELFTRILVGPLKTSCREINKNIYSFGLIFTDVLSQIIVVKL